jgi:HAD superfamily hydrolase (TIGR01509 family)
MRKFHTIIFDLDGLIADTEPLHQRAFNLVLEAAGADYQIPIEEYGRLFTGRAIFENAEYVRERFALAASAEDIILAHDALFNLLLADANNIEPMPGLGELIAFLQSHNLKLAVASGSRPYQVAKMLRGLNLAETFPVSIGGDLDIRPKPFPDLYLKALNEIQAQPAETLAIEDSVVGVRAAQAANLFVIAVKNQFTQHQDLSEANLVTHSLIEVKDYLAQNG